MCTVGWNKQRMLSCLPKLTVQIINKTVYLCSVFQSTYASQTDAFLFDRSSTQLSWTEPSFCALAQYTDKPKHAKC